MTFVNSKDIIGLMMKVKSVQIKNYRSIKEEISINLEKIGSSSCSILLGINESGKSNILDAIALLNKNAEFDYSTDCNNQAEEKGESVTITFEAIIENIEFYRDQAVKAGLSDELAKLLDVKEIYRKINFSKKNGRSDYYHIYIKSIAKKALDKYLVVDKNIVSRTPEQEAKDSDGKITNVLDKDELEEFLQDKLHNVLDRNLPKVVFWRMQEKYLISKEINLNEFKNDTSISVPLKNCFRIAGYQTDEEIKNVLESVETNTGKRATLQQKLGDDLTEHINKVWKGHNVSIKFNIDNFMLSFLVEDNDIKLPKYFVKQRSDGFQHFISILLNISAENKTKFLSNKIILLDEPETHLHPSGEKYLRNELLKIAKNNFVVFATHSIFMVDTKNIDRHYSIDKEKGVTKVSAIEKDNPFREDVLYEALGTSVLEVIEPNVLIFEGKTDRDVYELYSRKFKSKIKPPKLSTISADSNTSIIKYTKFFNKTLVNGYVLVDSDDSGIIEKNKILELEGYNSNNTFEINDIVKTNKKAELEDLFNKEYLISSVKECFDLEIDLDEKKEYMPQIKDVLQKNKKRFKDKEKELLKKTFFTKIKKLKKEDLEKQAYYKFCNKLYAKIK